MSDLVALFFWILSMEQNLCMGAVQYKSALVANSQIILYVNDSLCPAKVNPNSSVK